jgi:hypothetical protein
MDGIARHDGGGCAGGVDNRRNRDTHSREATMIQRGGRPVAGFGVGDWTPLTAPYQLKSGTRYAATIELSWAEKAIATDTDVADKFKSAGFTDVTVDLPNKRAEGTWSGEDRVVTLPSEIAEVWQSSTDSPAATAPEPPAAPAAPESAPEPPVPPADTTPEPATSAVIKPSAPGERTGNFTRETPLPMTQNQRQAAIDAWSASSGYVKITLPDGTAGFKGSNGDLLQANGMPYVPPTPFDLLEWVRSHQMPIAIGAVVVGSAIAYKLFKPVTYATA